MTNSDEIDVGYKHIVTVVLNLNHDRYKSYFNYFTVIHFGLIAAMTTTVLDKITGARMMLSLVGIFLSIAWIHVLNKISMDIKRAWEIIENFEKSENYKGTIKIHETRGSSGNKTGDNGPRWLSVPASKIMTAVPIAFIALYVFMFIGSFGVFGGYAATGSVAIDCRYCIVTQSR